MKMPKTIAAAAISTALIALFGFPFAVAQNAADGVPAELAPLAAKYQSDLKVLAEARDKTVAPARQTYLAALATAEQKAASSQKPEESKAVGDEKTAVSAGTPLPAMAAPLLPATLLTPRTNLRREMDRAEREYGVRAQQAAADYLRGLTFYENNARAAGQTELLKQIEAEKGKLAGQNAAGAHAIHGAARNLVINGDFTQKKQDGTPESWKSDMPKRGAVATEQGASFLRLVSLEKGETFFVEELDRPPDVKELAVALRLRCKDMKGQGTYGVVIAQRDGDNKLVARDMPCDMSGPAPAWKTMSGLVRIHPETKRLIVRCNIVDCLATVDFADVRVDAK